LLAAAGNVYNTHTTTPATQVSLGTSKSKCTHTATSSATNSATANNQKFHALNFQQCRLKQVNTVTLHNNSLVNINQYTLNTVRKIKHEQQTKFGQFEL